MASRFPLIRASNLLQLEQLYGQRLLQARPLRQSQSIALANTRSRWPAIVGIIIGALIVLSLLWCAVRCLCCGMTCCCSCLSCCDCCCPSGRRGNGSRDRHRDQPPSFPPASYHGYQPAPPPPSYEAPQFAQFDVSKNRPGRHSLGDDALPPMPSWETASSRKVPEQRHGAEEGLEMGRLDPLAGQQAPMLASAAPPPRAGYAEADSSPVPHSPYQFQHQQQAGFPGGDLASPYGRQPSPVAYGGYGNPQAYEGSTHPQELGTYGGGGGGGYGQQQAYSAYSTYAPSASTRYEPTVNYQQTTGVVQSARSPAPRQPQYGNIASVPPVGRKPVQGSWRDT